MPVAPTVLSMLAPRYPITCTVNFPFKYDCEPDGQATPYVAVNHVATPAMSGCALCFAKPKHGLVAEAVQAGAMAETGVL